MDTKGNGGGAVAAHSREEAAFETWLRVALRDAYSEAATGPVPDCLLLLCDPITSVNVVENRPG